MIAMWAQKEFSNTERRRAVTIEHPWSPPLQKPQRWATRRPQNEDTSARRVRAKSTVAGGADRPLLENREKWRTPSFFWSTKQDGRKLYSAGRRGAPAQLCKDRRVDLD
jgi:hypothetical protein